ncbi:hypothetical protein J437_LFUL002068 [Ladona fulva]|uniref:Alpha-taxilin n=1 Tax=Ladona fulva TaxID=123851 RepID=A0A8K0K0W3_LADFU|nr:hypothetical protein J437_LFUL002068 [Ladona fulva]
MDTDGSTETTEKMISTTESKDTEVKPIEVKERRTSKGDKIRKKDDKSVEQVLKALNSLETTEEKLAAMCKKYTDIVDENRKLQLGLKQCEKRCCILQREKEQLQTEHSKAVLSRSRLESLCRELQRQNKAIKEESLLKVREEEEKRKEVSAKFQGTLNEITALMQQNIEKNAKLKDENVEMAQRFGKLLEQYEIREQQVEKLLEQIHIETELGEAKMAKARMEMANEREVMLREKKLLLMDLEECRHKIQVLQEGEIGLRSQIRLYTDKYDEFQTALTRSSEVFNGFKGEMEKMSKKICKLEKETTSWKQRFDCSHQALLEMAADKQQKDAELALANRRLAQMQALCRTLQAERSSMLAQLREKGEVVKDKEEDGSDKIKDSEVQPKETDGSGEPKENTDSTPLLEVADPGEIKNEENISGSTLEVEKKEAGEILSLVQSKVNEGGVDSQTEPVIKEMETDTCSTICNNEESKSSSVDNGTSQNDVSPSAFKMVELLSNEKCEVASTDSSLVDLSPCENIIKEVENLEDANLAFLRDVELVKQKLDSCIINESLKLEVKEISKEGKCEANGENKAGTCSENQEVSEEKSTCKENELKIDVKETDIVEEFGKTCITSDESKMTQGCMKLENPCSPVALGENNQPSVESDSANHDQSSEGVTKQESYVSADSNLPEKCCNQIVDETAPKFISENDKEMKEKCLESTFSSSNSSKKDTSSLNTKKGKESSRKRKR